MKDLVAIIMALLLSTSIWAGPVHRKAFLNAYPWLYSMEIGKNRNTCFVCHEKRGDNMTPYGEHYFATGWNTGEFSFEVIEMLDSDEDGFDNITEIRQGTNPGDPLSHP